MGLVRVTEIVRKTEWSRPTLIESAQKKDAVETHQEVMVDLPNPDYVHELQHIVNTSPYPAHMSMRLASITMDEAVIELELGPCHLQPFGLVHGGVLATLIDTATFWAVFMRIPEDAGLVNIDLKLNYLKAVETGVLKAFGFAIRSGKTISYAEARVMDQNGDLVAHGTSTLMTLPRKGLHLTHRKFMTETPEP